MRFIKLVLFAAPLAHSVSAAPILGLLSGLPGGSSPSHAPAPVSALGGDNAVGVLGIVEELTIAVTSLVSSFLFPRSLVFPLANHVPTVLIWVNMISQCIG